MNNVGIKQLIVCLLTAVLLVSCTPKQVPAVTVTPLPTNQAGQVSTSTPEDKYQVNVWVDNPTPSRELKVILIGNLNKNGVYLGGIMMWAFWQDQNLQPGVPNCYVMVTYQRGVCVIDAGKYPSGQYVPIQIKFDIDGKKFYGQTGFTPK